MDLSDLFRRHILGQRTFEPLKLTENRRDTQANQRKKNRDNLLTARRNIKPGMSPCVTTPLVTVTKPASKRNNQPGLATSTPHVCPSQESRLQAPQQSDAVKRRLERLAQWKAEKEKKKQAAKAKEKPLFKVCHVSDTQPLTDSISALIKGKSMLTSMINKKSKFAPENSKFNPPVGVKPVPQFKFASSTHKVNKAENKLQNKKPSSAPTSTPRLTRGLTNKLANKSTAEKKVSQPTTKSSVNSKPISLAPSRSKSKLAQKPPKTAISKSSTPNSSSAKTAVTSTNANPGLYVSPFVTISRGKKEALREFQIRRSMGTDSGPINNYLKGKSPKDSKILTAHTSPKAGADYFMHQLNKEINRINDMCAQWQALLEDPELPGEATSSINVTIGHSQLLVTKKFNQFRGLIVQCKTQRYEEKEITCEDLHGFWDMIYMQVEDLDKRFGNLERMKANNWEEILPQKKVPVKKAKVTRAASKKPAANSKLRDMIKAARAKKMTENGEENTVDVVERIEARTPLKDQQTNLIPSTASSKRKKSLRVSILTAENQNKRCSSSPGLTMMKVSQSIKQNNGLTPFKSILKGDGCKSTGKKSVVFKEDVADPAIIKLRKTRLFDDLSSEKKHEQNVKNVKRNLGFDKEGDVSEKENTPTLRRSARARARRSLSVC